VLIWVDSLEGCKFVNRAYEQFAGVPAARLLGRGWTKLLHPEDRDAYLEEYDSTFERESKFERLARFRRADGKYRWMKTVGVPRRGEDGKFIGYVGSSTDITDLKEAENDLREADRAKDEFLGTVGHELRNPLAAISNAAHLLANSDGRGRQIGLGVIERQTRNMMRIVEDLLSVARITHGKITLRMRSVEVESVVRDAISATEHDRVPSRQTLEVSLPPEPTWVRVDTARFEQILVNLLGNASKFTPVGGHMWLDVKREGTGDSAKVVIRVRDDGPGIDPQVLPRIFDLFVQGGRPDDRARTGVGIGLSLARQLVEMHHGTIEAHNLPGAGSEFVVTMPAAPKSAERTEDPEPTPPAPPTVTRRVLIVDGQP
jgi:two-component system CheB/CheR fusion protein